MAFGAQPTDSNNIPIGSAYVPGVGFNAVQGGSNYTDGSSNISAPITISNVGGWKATYTTNIFGLVPVTAATDIFTLTGSATKTIRVLRVEFSMVITTATMIDLVFLKRSTANTAGTTTSTNLTTSSHDSNSAANTATILAYTANPTAGTLVGNLGNIKYLAQPATILPVVVIKEYGTRPSQQPVLRGTSQVFAVNLNGIALGGGQLADIAIEWSEE